MVLRTMGIIAEMDELGWAFFSLISRCMPRFVCWPPALGDLGSRAF
jgi:hypothetical protein